MTAGNKGSALVTGAGRRIGRAIAGELAAAGYRVLVHCHRSRDEAQALVDELNVRRADTAQLVCADLADTDELDALVMRVLALAPDLSLLVNNASAFFPTPLDNSTPAQWDLLVNSNLRAPYFLARGLHRRLADQGGSIVNLADIYAARPLPLHPVYTMTKAGIVALTQSLARELAPAVRVNAVAPGAILWPENATAAYREQLLEKIPLQRIGEPADIAGAVLYLAAARYVTGQVLAVDGGRSLHI